MRGSLLRHPGWWTMTRCIEKQRPLSTQTYRSIFSEADIQRCASPAAPRRRHEDPQVRLRRSGACGCWTSGFIACPASGFDQGTGVQRV